jgi:transcriptional/translational regulatory protein YebC/TACO1
MVTWEPTVLAYLFTKRGEISFEDVSLEDKIMEVALEAGADDIELMKIAS